MSENMAYVPAKLVAYMTKCVHAILDVTGGLPDNQFACLAIFPGQVCACCEGNNPDNIGVMLAEDLVKDAVVRAEDGHVMKAAAYQICSPCMEKLGLAKAQRGDPDTPEIAEFRAKLVGELKKRHAEDTPITRLDDLVNLSTAEVDTKNLN